MLNISMLNFPFFRIPFHCRDSYTFFNPVCAVKHKFTHTSEHWFRKRTLWCPVTYFYNKAIVFLWKTGLCLKNVFCLDDELLGPDLVLSTCEVELINIPCQNGVCSRTLLYYSTVTDIVRDGDRSTEISINPVLSSNFLWNGYAPQSVQVCKKLYLN